MAFKIQAIVAIIFSLATLTTRAETLTSPIWERYVYETPPPGRISITKKGKPISIGPKSKFVLTIFFQGKTNSINLVVSSYYRSYASKNYSFFLKGENDKYLLEKLEIAVEDNDLKLIKFLIYDKTRQLQLSSVLPYDDSYRPSPRPCNGFSGRC